MTLGIPDDELPMQQKEAEKARRWHKTEDRFPPHDTEVEITHPIFIGTRTAKLSTLMPNGWRLTDCQHPLQNAYAPITGSAWRLID